MQTKVSTKGQIVLPHPIRRRLGIRAGDPFDADIEAGRIVLTPIPKLLRKARIIDDPVSGMPVLTLGDDAPVLRSEEVAELLANFP